MADLVLAVDIGGTKIAAGLVDRAGRLVRHAVRPTAPPVFEAVRAATEELGPGPVAAAGLSCAGPVDAVAGTVSPINIPTWRDFPLRARIGALLPDVPIALAGDGQCMALGEHWLGAGRGSDSMLGMVVSTGVGGGLVLNGRPFAGRSGNSGHVGHVIAEPAGGDECTCGGRGCVETVASGPSMVRWAHRNGWTMTPMPADVVLDAGQNLAASTKSVAAPDPARRHAASTGRRVSVLGGPGRQGVAGAEVGSGRGLALAAAGGDPVAVAAFRRGGRALGLAIVAVAAVCDLELVVVGGGVAQAGELLFAPVREALAEHAGLSYLAGLRVVPAELGTSAGLFGAAALAFHEL